MAGADLKPGLTTRFAPSPTGWLHLGHALSAITGHDRARAAGGRFLLRIEDTDRARFRPEYDAAILDDLTWLGLTWDGPVLRQSAHLGDYEAALDRLIALGLCYPCRCSRAEIRAALSAPQEGAVPPAYPGTCRHRTMAERGPGDAIRLDMARALAATGPLSFREIGPEREGTWRLDPAQVIAHDGDIVLSRRDIGPAYHLTVVVDDARQGVTEVTRGLDLFEASFPQIVLQALLELPQPSYYHHRLIRDETGKRLAKRDDARALCRYRADGATPQDIRRMIGL